MTGISAEQTLGQSPKVVWPGVAIAGLGVVLVLVGELTDSARARAAGLGALAASALTVGLGYVAPPGAVVAPDHDVADSHEHDAAHRITRFEPAVDQASQSGASVSPSA